MSSLRKPVRSTRAFKVALFSLGLLAVSLVAFDLAQPPPRQIAARAYATGVIGGYQKLLRPLTASWVRCRYRPTCSEYSREAVRRFGLPKGLLLTAGRLRRCRPSVKMGTRDPVPAR